MSEKTTGVVRASLALTIPFICMASSAHATPIYSNDFSSNTAGFTTTNGVGVASSPSGQRFLELPNAQSTTDLTLDTSSYIGGSLSVAFSLYVVGSMDGTGPIIQGGGAGDYFTVTSGAQTLFNNAFANYDGGNLQTYPAAGSLPATGAASINTLGYSGFPDSGNRIQDSTYNFVVTFSPTAASTTLTFTSLANEGPGNEFYGIDNVVANATPAVAAVPEPATWAMMLAGFGMIGFAARRRASVKTNVTYA